MVGTSNLGSWNGHWDRDSTQKPWENSPRRIMDFDQWGYKWLQRYLRFVVNSLGYQRTKTCPALYFWELIMLIHTLW